MSLGGKMYIVIVELEKLARLGGKTIVDMTAEAC
jgi:predicted metal-dependent phosphotriesterase family hydrolase